MKNKESRRIVPVSVVATTAFAVLVVFEALVMGGALEVRASAVAKVAPWAYEPFLKLVGEDPESLRNQEAVRRDAETGGLSAVETFAGLGSGVPVEGAETGSSVPDVIEIPQEDELPETNAPPAETNEEIPVG